MLLRALLLLSVVYFTYPLALLSTYMILRLYIFSGVCEKYLDLVSILAVQNLTSSKDVTAVAVYFILLEIRVFVVVCCCSLWAYVCEALSLYLGLQLSFYLDFLLYLLLFTGFLLSLVIIFLM